MSSRFQKEQITSSTARESMRSSSTLKHRLELDDDEDDSAGHPAQTKRRKFVFAPFSDQVKDGRREQSEVFNSGQSHRHYRRQVHAPESPLVRDLEGESSSLSFHNSRQEYFRFHRSRYAFNTDIKQKTTPILEWHSTHKL